MSMNKPLSIRMLLTFLVFLLVYGFVPVASKNTDDVIYADTAATSEGAGLKVWQTNIVDYTPALQAYLNNAASSVEVALSTVPIQDLQDKLKIAIAAGEAPDLVVMPNWQIDPINNPYDIMFKNLNQIDATAVKSLKSSLAKGVWGTVNPSYRSAVSFVPLNSEAPVWYYRNDLFHKAGLPSTPEKIAAKYKNWNSVPSIGQTLRAATSSSLFGQPGELFDAMLFQRSPVYYDAKGKYIGGSNPQIKTAYNTVASGLSKGWIGRYQPYSVAYKSALGSGKIASMIGSYSLTISFADPIKKSGASNWSVALLPGTYTDSGAFSLGIPLTAQHPAAAMELIQWLVSPDMQRWAFEEHQLFPVNLKLLSDPEWTKASDPLTHEPIRAVMAQATRLAKPNPLSNEPRTAITAFSAAIERLRTNSKADPANEWKTAVKAASQEAAKAKSAINK